MNAFKDRHKLWIIGRRGPVGLRGAIERTRELRAESKLHLDEGVSADIAFAQKVTGLERTSALDAPLRAPHHSVSALGMTGALRGHVWRPGEIALAHGGVLYLDDATEFRLEVIEMVASAFRLGCQRLSSNVPSRVGTERIGEYNSLVVPTWFSLVVGTLPCPCGNRGVWDAPCPCTERDIERFHDRVRPLVDGAEVVRL